ncbi:MAG: DUF2384 domain-containing protein [bacterium]|nr:DUF2384 domain-containing protein [bacterium]
MSPLAAYAEPTAMPTGESVRIARLLDLDDAEYVDDVGLAQRITAGLKPKSVTALSELLGSGSVVGPVVPEATLRRVRKNRTRLSKEHSERLYELSRVVDAVSRAYHGDSKQITSFLSRPHPLLDGSTPFDMARSNSAGADAVLNLLRRADAGVAL